MARYRLKGKHYLNVEGTDWEQVEVDLTTGKQVRKRYPVPTYLDPEDSSCHNYPGEVIVSSKASNAFPRDLIFKGLPSLDMEPLDDEAQAEWDKVSRMGEHPIDSLPTNGQTFSDHLLEKLTQQLDTLTTRGSAPIRASDEVADLRRQIEELKAMVMGKAIPEDKIEYEPLPELPLSPPPPKGLVLGAK
jgi:hypothetical protein